MWNLDEINMCLIMLVRRVRVRVSLTVYQLNRSRKDLQRETNNRVND